MAANDAAPAGSRKYLLVKPDTFDLLVKNFDQVQRIKHQPAIKMALEFEKAVQLVKQSEKTPNEKQNTLTKLFLHYTEMICKLYKVKEWCEEEKKPPEKEDDHQLLLLEEKQFAYNMPPSPKKMKWVSFRK